MHVNIASYFRGLTMPNKYMKPPPSFSVILVPTLFQLCMKKGPQFMICQYYSTFNSLVEIDVFTHVFGNHGLLGLFDEIGINFLPCVCISLLVRWKNQDGQVYPKALCYLWFSATPWPNLGVPNPPRWREGPCRTCLVVFKNSASGVVFTCRHACRRFFGNSGTTVTFSRKHSVWILM